MKGELLTWKLPEVQYLRIPGIIVPTIFSQQRLPSWLKKSPRSWLIFLTEFWSASEIRWLLLPRGVRETFSDPDIEATHNVHQTQFHPFATIFHSIYSVPASCLSLFQNCSTKMTLGHLTAPVALPPSGTADAQWTWLLSCDVLPSSFIFWPYQSCKVLLKGILKIWPDNRTFLFLDFKASLPNLSCGAH